MESDAFEKTNVESSEQSPSTNAGAGDLPRLADWKKKKKKHIAWRFRGLPSLEDCN
jgi:beta-lactamase class A